MVRRCTSAVAAGRELASGWRAATGLLGRSGATPTSGRPGGRNVHVRKSPLVIILTGVMSFAGHSGAGAAVQAQVTASGRVSGTLVPASPSDCDGPASESEIVVCGSSDQARYRLEPSEGWDPNGTVDSVLRERRRMLELGDTGISSCSTVGPGGWTGCQFKRWREAQEQNPYRHSGRRGTPSIRIGRIGQ